MELTTLTQQQLIARIKQLQSDFQDFYNHSAQVEDLLQQQLDSSQKQIIENNSQIKALESQLANIESLHSKVTSLEIENDVLESTEIGRAHV